MLPYLKHTAAVTSIIQDNVSALRNVENILTDKRLRLSPTRAEKLSTGRLM